ncbi:MAG: RNA polymerase sigma factor RpoD/SigA [Verrucomicrobia bacterium]|nr:RNA polymerase sigma factor RpoD/SigA [Verrucomicrobiota bacterium]
MKPFKTSSGEEPESGLRVYLREIGQVALLTPQQDLSGACRGWRARGSRYPDHPERSPETGRRCPGWRLHRGRT